MCLSYKIKLATLVNGNNSIQQTPHYITSSARGGHGCKHTVCCTIIVLTVHYICRKKVIEPLNVWGGAQGSDSCQYTAMRDRAANEVKHFME
jgi:hypothetical protein